VKSWGPEGKTQQQNPKPTTKKKKKTPTPHNNKKKNVEQRVRTAARVGAAGAEVQMTVERTGGWD